MSSKESQNMGNKNDVTDDFKLTAEEWRKMQFTNVFRFWKEDIGIYLDCFYNFKYTDEGIQKAMQEIDDFYCKNLYVMPQAPPYDFYINYYNWQLSLLVDYFKEVFEEKAFIKGYQPSNKYSRLILPKTLHDEIINCINDYELLIIRDLLFEIIAIAREKYTSEIASWEKPEMQKLIRTAQKETEKAINLIERLEIKGWLRGDPNARKPSELSHINFVFNDGSVKIRHAWLAREFIEHFKNHYNNLFFKNWKMDLKRYPDRFEENIRDQQFKYRLAKSLYNLLTETGLFKIDSAKTPNNLMLCIAKLMEFCLIPAGSFDESNEVKIKNIRNWIKRKEFETDVISADIPANLERLKKHFEEDFIDLAEVTKGADVIRIGGSIAKRFNIESLFSDLVHIAQSLKESRMFIGHQLSVGGMQPPAPFQEFENFRKLIDGIKGKQKITSIKFSVEGSDEDNELTQRLPLYLIEEALRDYCENQAVEIDTELVPTKITKVGDEIRVEKDAIFTQPKQRFMVRFTESFYNYLSEECPVKDDEYQSPEKYYAIIANLLQQSWFFQHLRHDEWFIINKVKEWHKLSQLKSDNQ